MLQHRFRKVYAIRPMFAFATEHHYDCSNISSVRGLVKSKKPKQKGMRCICGHDFAQQTMQGRHTRQSFAVANRRDYQTFLKLEMKVLQERRGTDDRLRAIARSSEDVGSLYVCPKCSRSCCCSLAQVRPMVVWFSTLERKCNNE